MRRIILLITIFLLIKTSLLLAPLGRAENIRIFVVLSYYPGHICSTPQFKGFIHGLKEISERVFKVGNEFRMFRFNVRYDFLRSIKQNVTEVQKQRKATIIMQKIRDFDPTFVVTIDDNAFQYVGIPESESDKIVLFSGLNEPLKKYVDTYDISIRTIYGVEENIDLTKFFELLKNSSFTLINVYFLQPPVHTMLNTERYILQSIIKQFMSHSMFRIFQNEISTYNQLVETIKELQKQPIGIIVPIIQKTIKGNYVVPNNEVMCTIYKYNKKHLVLGFNPEFCKYGCPITCSMNFYESGYFLATKILQKILLGETEKLKHVYHVPSEIAINRKIVKELGFEKLIQNKYIDRYMTGLRCLN